MSNFWGFLHGILRVLRDLGIRVYGFFVRWYLGSGLFRVGIISLCV